MENKHGPEFVRERVGDAAREWLFQQMDFQVVLEMMQNLSLKTFPGIRCEM